MSARVLRAVKGANAGAEEAARMPEHDVPQLMREGEALRGRVARTQEHMPFAPNAHGYARRVACAVQQGGEKRAFPLRRKGERLNAQPRRRGVHVHGQRAKAQLQ